MPDPTECDVPAPAPERWRLVLLGLPRLVREIPPASHALSAKDAALLAMVALDGPLSADRIAALVWPGVDARKAATSLRQRLYRLRHECGVSPVETGGLLRLAPQVETDLAPTLSRLAEDTGAGTEQLLGDLDFDDWPELAEWVGSVRQRWHQQCIAVLAAAAARCEAEGAVARGLAFAERLAQADPVSEHALRRVMRLHYLRGDCSAAIAAFERFEQRLKDELGTRPSAETIELLATIERAAASLPTRRAIAPASLLRPPRLVGRTAEAAALAKAWADQRAFVLLGEGGIGKSRLLQDFRPAVEDVVTVRARPGDAGIAYAVLARLLRAVLARAPTGPDPVHREALALILPELGAAAAIAGEAQRLMLQRAVEATLTDAARAGLGGIVVDDLHFADDASIECVQAAMQAETLAGLHWGFAQRPADASAASAALKTALEENRRLETVQLGPLGAADLVELIDSLALGQVDAAALAPALLKHTGGNPLFVLETVKDMVLAGATGAAGRLPQPTSVGALIERRLSQLSPAALKLARAAALAGQAFSAELAVAVLDAHPLDIAEPWRELESAQVIRGDAFAHDLILEAARASVPAPIAQLLHRRVAEFLRARDAQAAIVAPHWAGAHEWALAGAAYVQAAREAQRASQRRHELGHWDAAHACFERAGDAEGAFDARCDSVPALIVVHGVAHANGVIDSLLASARGDRQRAAALTARAMAALMAADHPVGIAAAIEAGTLAAALPSPWPRFEAARLHAVGLAQSGRSAEALAAIEPFREIVERDGGVEQKASFWSDYAYVLNTARRLRDTAYALERASENAAARGDLAELATLTSNLATVKGNLGSVDDALALARRAQALQAELGATDGPAGGVVETYVALYCGMSGRYDEALERLDAALARFKHDGQTTWIAVASNHQAALLTQLGQFARARQALGYEAPPVDAVRARGAALASRIDRALGVAGDGPLQRALEILGSTGDPHVRMQAHLDAVERAEPDEALQRCEHVLRDAEALEFGGVVLRARLLQAATLLRGGRAHEALAPLRALVPRLEHAVPADMYPPEGWWIAFQVFDVCGASDEALMALAQGLRWVRQTALPHVRAPFQDSFLQRNPVNRALLAAGTRRTGLPAAAR